jgi:hypothetical protein
MCPAASTYDTIDDHLGPATGRFFGTGFRRVSQRITDVVVEQAAGTITAQAGITYPADWSTKSPGRSLTPHVSTIDAAVLSVALAESYLTHTLNLDDEQRRGLWLRRLVIKAGATPQEQLADFTVSAWHAGITSDRETTLSVFDCRIGGLRTRCDIVHPAGRRRTDTGPAALRDDLLGDPQRRYYGRGFQARDHQLRDVHVVPDHGEASADVHFGDTRAFPDGFGGRHQPSVTVIDGMVVLAQLAQSLLYRLDDIDRRQSDTLWMRRVEVTANSPEPPLAEPFRSSTAVMRSVLVNFNGGRWRTSDWTAQFSGLRFGYRLAHRLPTTDLVGVR